MIVSKALLELQEMELRMSGAAKRLAQIQALVKDDPELAAARAELGATDAGLKQLQTEQKSVDWDVESAKTRHADLQSRMMSGAGATARDLPSIQKEMVHLKERQGSLEDKELEMLEQIEALQRTREAQTSRVRELEARWQESRRELLEEQALIEGELPQWTAQREEALVPLDGQTRLAYERLRAKKGGQAVARVEKGMCSGCRIGLPTTLIQRARSGQALVFCSSCGRILFAG